jgi:hypothetical protein
MEFAGVKVKGEGEERGIARCMPFTFNLDLLQNRGEGYKLWARYHAYFRQ